MHYSDGRRQLYGKKIVTKKKIERHTAIIINCILVFLALSCLYPFLVILGTSFQSEADIMESGYKILPGTFSLEAYKSVLQNPYAIINAYKVTIITTLMTTFLGLYVVSTYAYVVSRKDYKYRKILSFYVFFTMLFSGGMVPSYILIANWLGLKDNLLALILPLVANAWNILLMKGFFQSIPTALIEAAKIDGASEMCIFTKIVVPISKPAFATIALFYILASWNDWQLSLLYIDSDSKIKLQYLLVKILNNIEFLNSYDAIKYGLVREPISVPTNSARMAMCVLAAGPIVVIFPFFQKYFVKGISVGSVKG